jgi:competence protein ComEC
MFQRLLYAAATAAALTFSGSALAAPDVQPSERVETAVIVRAEPSTDSARLDRLEPGEALILDGDVPGWYRVRLPDGRPGYVSKAWTVVIDEVSAAAAAPYRVHAIDVGTGLALFVEGPDFTLLYDGGSNDDTARGAGNRILAYIKSIRPTLSVIDHVILSHPHKDHVELLPDVLDDYQVRNVWDSGRVHPICGYRYFLSRIRDETGIAYHDAHNVVGPHVASFPASTCYGRPEPAQSITLPHGSRIQERLAVNVGQGARMTFLTADPTDHGSPNENSVVVRLDLGSKRLLLMGDAEAGGRQDPSVPPNQDSVEGRLLACCVADLRADLLVAGHHGSKTSSRALFLDAVGARDFLISAGPTRYGSVTLPDSVTVNEMDRRGNVWRTDTDDLRCRTNAAKIGPDNDNQPGGCDNVLVLIPPSGPIAITYRRVAD